MSKKKPERYRGHNFKSGPIRINASELKMKDLIKLRDFLIKYCEYWKDTK